MLKTEMRNQNTMHIDRMETAEMVRVIQDENINAAKAVESELPAISKAIDAITERMQRGGRLFYVGCGTSGRLGVLDASECPPTYGVPSEMFVGVIAGGPQCMFTAAEAQEDDPNAAIADLKAKGFRAGDVLIGISASGGAAYVVSALNYARSLGSAAIAIVNNQGTKMEKAADTTIVLDTGAEVITGSTRMKAGTAQKIVLNMLSTMSLVKCGYVYENLMINLRPTNIKLRGRMIGIVCDILGCDAKTAEEKLESAAWNIRAAVEK